MNSTIADVTVEWFVEKNRVIEIMDDLKVNGYTFSQELMRRSIDYYNALVYFDGGMLIVSYELKMFCYYQ